MTITLSLHLLPGTTSFISGIPNLTPLTMRGALRIENHSVKPVQISDRVVKFSAHSTGKCSRVAGTPGKSAASAAKFAAKAAVGITGDSIRAVKPWNIIWCQQKQNMEGVLTLEGKEVKEMEFSFTIPWLLKAANITLPPTIKFHEDMHKGDTTYTLEAVATARKLESKSFFKQLVSSETAPTYFRLDLPLVQTVDLRIPLVRNYLLNSSTVHGNAGWYSDGPSNLPSGATKDPTPFTLAFPTLIFHRNHPFQITFLSTTAPVQKLSVKLIQHYIIRSTSIGNADMAMYARSQMGYRITKSVKKTILSEQLVPTAAEHTFSIQIPGDKLPYLAQTYPSSTAPLDTSGTPKEPYSILHTLKCSVTLSSGEKIKLSTPAVVMDLTREDVVASIGEEALGRALAEVMHTDGDVQLPTYEE
ncbi:hypothetical protein HDV00_010904 [Rhizophlyctis rosea]|nr:hypothetical protein HDV00_010904 [Rhizophlyctis rosea]